VSGPDPRTRGAVAALSLTIVIFGCQFVDARYAISQGLSVYDLVALRFGVAGTIGFCVLARAGLADLGGLGWRRGAILAVLAGSPYSLAMIGGLHFAPVAHGALLNPGLNLIASTFFGIWLLGERHPAFRFLGMAVVSGGLAMIGWDGLTAVGQRFWIGDLLFAATGVAWGLFGTLTRRWHAAPLTVVSAIAMVSLPYLPLYAVWLAPTLNHVSIGWLAFHGFYQGVLQSFIGILGYAYAAQVLGPSRTAVATALVPVTGIIAAIPFLGEWPEPLQWTGLAVVVAGMVLANYTRAAARASEDVPATP
jgi:drug/metabolite transporter (DMT)-like permease